ncbi:Flp pilus assembly protein TadG [Paraburkholderia sp. WC7.3g]|uniref:Pilus assembly protein n=1 Tax=Paraburkholderia podalyriae TaxID=1938811 RepID=A0ABR7PKQ7_9BURK|nr:TadE/TadG family type IV pilus assembly protein [Paraburkholderia podalyriae]MBC8746944.1 pilus assembly protein [Paraburkholderia podalyriae]
MKTPTLRGTSLRGQRGATAVEFALVSGMLCMLLIGICEFSRVLFDWNTASEAVRLGARTAVVCDANAAVIKTRMQALLPLLNNANVDVSYLPAGCDADVSTARNSCNTVTVSITGVTVQTIIPFVPQSLTMPPFTTTLPRESLTSSSGGTTCN